MHIYLSVNQDMEFRIIVLAQTLSVHEKEDLFF